MTSMTKLYDTKFQESIDRNTKAGGKREQIINEVQQWDRLESGELCFCVVWWVANWTMTGRLAMVGYKQDHELVLLQETPSPYIV